jgi:hypothetical protein
MISIKEWSGVGKSKAIIDMNRNNEEKGFAIDRHGDGGMWR